MNSSFTTLIFTGAKEWRVCREKSWIREANLLKRSFHSQWHKMSHKEDRSQVVRSLHLTRVSLCVHMKTISAAICGMRFSICARRRALSLSGVSALACCAGCILTAFQVVFRASIQTSLGFAMWKELQICRAILYTCILCGLHTHIQELTRGGAQQKQLQSVGRPFHPLCAWIAAAAPLWNAVMCALNPLAACCAQGICCLCVSAFHSRSISNDLQRLWGRN